MDSQALDKVCKSIYRRFPNVKGSRPKVSTQGEDRYLLIFSAKGETPDGKTITQTLRVVADETGRVLKTSMSR